MTRPRRHWSKLPPIAGFTRAPDGPDGRRRLFCDVCAVAVTSHQIGHHRTTSGHQARLAARRASRSVRWHVQTAHKNCNPCREAADRAVDLARATGSTGATITAEPHWGKVDQR